MKKTQLQIGSLLILFTVIMVCVAVFAVLTGATAATDYKVSKRYGDRIELLYECENQGQQWLCDVDNYIHGDGKLPNNTEQEGNLLSTTIFTEQMSLSIIIEITDDNYIIREWKCIPVWIPDMDLHVWQ